MNHLFLTLLYPEKAVAEVTRDSKDGLQNQINNYQWAFVKGMEENLREGETLSILNAMPVGVFPLHYRKLFLPSREWQEGFSELGSWNLPWVKQWQRKRKAAKAINQWAKASAKNRSVLIYSLYLPYLQAVLRAKKSFPDLRATVIVTDLPNELGIASGRQGFLKRMEYRMGREKMELCRELDGFVLLTKHMAEALPLDGKAQMVMEGMILPQAPAASLPEPEEAEEPKPFPVVLYTGTLNRELGIGELLAAFEYVEDCELWLCGRGDMEDPVKAACKTNPRIRYFGFVSQSKALRLQLQADLLINPRTRAGVFTRYSFPSKTLEYMRSGKPVLCFRLEGIPKEYDGYLRYIQGEGGAGILEAIRDLLALPIETREKMGAAAKDYVLSQKNAKVQSQKLMAFLRSLR